MKLLLYLTIFASTLGSSAIGINLGGFVLSPFRILIILSFIVFFVKSKGKIQIIKHKGAISFPLVMLIWLLYSLVMLIWAKDRIAGLKALFFIATAGALLLMLVKEFTGREHILNACKAFSMGVLLQALVGLSEVLTGVYRFADQSQEFVQIYMVRKLPVAMWYNVNDYATVLVFGCVTTLILFLTEERKKAKFLWFCVEIVSAISVFISGSRANLIGLLLLYVIVLMAFRKTKWMIVPVAITAFMCLFFSSGLQVYISELLGIGEISTRASDSYRVLLIKDALGFLGDTFGFGVGPAQLSIWSGAKRGTMGGNVHNWWIEVLSSYGIVFFVIYMIGYVKMIIYNYDIVVGVGDRTDKRISACLFAFLIAFFVCAVSSSTLSNNEAMWTLFDIIIMWCLIGNQGILNRKTVKRFIC